MLSSFSVLDDDVVRSVQQGYITEADHQRLLKSIEGPSLWDKWMTKLHMLTTREQRRSHSHKTHTLARV